MLRSETVANPAPFGNLMQTINAVQFRNKLIRFRASVRVESSTGGRAQLWVRVDRPGGQMGFFDNMQQRPIRSAVWQEYEIRGEVAADATVLNFGLMLIGGGAARLDAASFDVVGEVKVAPTASVLPAGGMTAEPRLDKTAESKPGILSLELGRTAVAGRDEVLERALSLFNGDRERRTPGSDPTDTGRCRSCARSRPTGS